MTGKPPFPGPAGIIVEPGREKVAMIPEGELATIASAEADKAAPDATETVRVAIRSPFQVTHDHRSYLPGDTAEVPRHVAQRWLRNKWVEVIEDEPPRRSSKK